MLELSVSRNNISHFADIWTKVGNIISRKDVHVKQSAGVLYRRLAGSSELTKLIGESSLPDEERTELFREYANLSEGNNKLRTFLFDPERIKRMTENDIKRVFVSLTTLPEFVTGFVEDVYGDKSGGHVRVEKLADMRTIRNVFHIRARTYHPEIDVDKIVNSTLCVES